MFLHPLQSAIAPPPKFTYPFCYEPHPLCLQAAAEVQRYIASQGCWREEISRGKMFGVLVVAVPGGGMAYLAAYSGQLCGRNDWPFFVPAVFDILQPGGHFKEKEGEITAINARLAELEAAGGEAEAQRRLAEVRRICEEEEARYKATMAEAKLRRDALRADGADEAALVRQSQHMKAELRRMKKRHAEMADEAARAVTEAGREAEGLRAERRRRSDELQAWIFSQFRMLNAEGRRRDLNDIFRAETGGAPPSGAGECCAPKLLQCAYEHGLKPLCMAEFWWGESPKAELRRHLNYYPACRGKCLPILKHMLQGVDVDPDPLRLDDCGRLETVYEDGFMAVVNKPPGLLSVPGRTERRSVESILRAQWGGEAEPFMVHRLDMDTSGLLVVAKSEEARRLLQAQFEGRSVRKRYVALLDTPRLQASEGRISLPIRPDPMDRPRQVVDREGGREAVTYWHVTGVRGGHVRLALHPLTGRTHQLRVHCAHPDGLGAPILGDALYGRRADRLYLHAESLELCHPATGRLMSFKAEAGF